jgi:hypothetical protein
MNAWVWILIAIVAVLVIATVAYAAMAARRRRELRTGFGPEYDRALESADSRREAESELRERVARHDEFDLRELDRDERQEYLRAWDGVQARFVDEPVGAIREADALIQDVMRARGYPVDDFDQRAADLSVEHPAVVENYRGAHTIAGRAKSGDATTEELRRGVVHYRALFDELVGVAGAGRMEATS